MQAKFHGRSYDTFIRHALYEAIRSVQVSLDSYDLKNFDGSGTRERAEYQKTVKEYRMRLRAYKSLLKKRGGKIKYDMECGDAMELVTKE